VASRREFLTQVGQAGGFAGAFVTMRALGLMPIEPSASTLSLAPNAGAGVRVVILGGGIAGLVSAYEMSKVGFVCTVLEARSRPGGRNWTVRNGTSVEFMDGTKQVAQWEPESYLNAGPARLPSIHKTILGYCRELGVPLEVEVNSSRSARLVNGKAFDGRPVEQRQVINDTRGHVSELLAKCVDQYALDEELTKPDRERMLELLRVYGDLKDDLTYKGSIRSGAARLPGAGPVPQETRPPLDLHALLDAGFWRGALFEEQLTMQATMFQPVGGMDRIPYAFAKRLGPVVQYKAPVVEIRKTAVGVRIVYEQNGIRKSVEADYCICALPITILKSTPNDFSPEVKQAIQKTEYSDAFKVAWESKRFWETDFNIYGGISFVVGGPVELVWYPSARLFSDTGVLISGYAAEGDSPFSKLGTVDAKFAASRTAVEQLHPGYGTRLSRPIYVNWGKIAYNEGSWVGREPNQTERDPNAAARAPNAATERATYYDGPYKTFIEPDGRIYFAGDHCARVGAWQEGAALSAHRTVQMICERVRMTRTA
jgi:monoamine oxidase